MSITCPILRRALLGALTLTGVAFATSTLGAAADRTTGALAARSA